MFDLYIIDVWRKNPPKTWPICDIVTGTIKSALGHVLHAMLLNKTNLPENNICSALHTILKSYDNCHGFCKKRVWNNRTAVETLASEIDQNILRAWTMPANCSIRTICHPHVDWPNSRLFTSIFLQFNILKQCLSSESSVTGCRFQKKSFRLINWKRG